MHHFFYFLSGKAEKEEISNTNHNAIQVSNSVQYGKVQYSAMLHDQSSVQVNSIQHTPTYYNATHNTVIKTSPI